MEPQSNHYNRVQKHFREKRSEPEYQNKYSTPTNEPVKQKISFYDKFCVEKKSGRLSSIIHLLLLLCIIHYLHDIHVNLIKNNELIERQILLLSPTNQPLEKKFNEVASQHQLANQINKHFPEKTIDKTVHQEKVVQSSQNKAQSKKKIYVSKQVESNSFLSKPKQPVSKYQRIDSQNKVYQPTTHKKSTLIDFEPYKLKKDTSIYSKDGMEIIQIQKSVLVSLYLDRIPNKWFKVKLESWVIDSWQGKQFIKNIQNHKARIISRVNTRSAPQLDYKFVIGVVSQNLEFNILRKKFIGNQKWYKIVIKGYVKADALR